MLVHHQARRGTDPIAVLTAGHELSDGLASGFLHGDTFGFGAVAQCVLLFLGEPKGHGHTIDGIGMIPP